MGAPRLPKCCWLGTGVFGNDGTVGRTLEDGAPGKNRRALLVDPLTCTNGSDIDRAWLWLLPCSR